TIVGGAMARARAAPTPGSDSSSTPAASRASLDHELLARIVTRPDEARQRGRLAGEHPEGGAWEQVPQQGIDRPVDGRAELEAARVEAGPRALEHGPGPAGELQVEDARARRGSHRAEDQPASLGIGVEVLEHDEDERSPVGCLGQRDPLLQGAPARAPPPAGPEAAAGHVDRHVGHGDAVGIADDRAPRERFQGALDPRVGRVLVARADAEVRDADARETVPVTRLPVLDQADRLAPVGAVDGAHPGHVALVPYQADGVARRAGHRDRGVHEKDGGEVPEGSAARFSSTRGTLVRPCAPTRAGRVSGSVASPPARTTTRRPPIGWESGFSMSSVALPAVATGCASSRSRTRAGDPSGAGTSATTGTDPRRPSAST